MPNDSLPTAPSGEEQTDAQMGAIARANQELDGLCDGSRKFTMSIPAQDTDSDIVIGDALSIAESAIARLASLSTERARMERALTEIRDDRNPSIGRWREIAEQALGVTPDATTRREG